MGEERGIVISAPDFKGMSGKPISLADFCANMGGDSPNPNKQ